jgi:hypothetical protein
MTDINLNQPSFGGSNLGSGPFNGFSTKQTVNGHREYSDINTRVILKNSWNGPYATGKYYGTNGVQYNRVVTPFRAVMNSGDFLGRVNYSCGGSNQVNASKPGWKHLIGSIIQQCDGTGVPASNCNPKFVADSSVYTRYLREKAANKTFNDLKDGGYDHSQSFIGLFGVPKR